MNLRRFLLGLFTAVLTLAVILGAGLWLAKQEEPTSVAPVETLPEVTRQQTQPTTLPTLPPETTVPMEQEKISIDTVPLYYQTDYPHDKFGTGTIATSGCSVTCLAMVATYLTDQEYTPPQMAYHFGNVGKTHVERLDYGIAQMRLPCERTENIQEVMQALDSGKVVIAMMDEESYFTEEQHFIVLAGRNEAGKIVVNDPLEPNYIRAEVYIKDGYDNGFEDHYLFRGFSGAWIFDKASMGENPFLFDAGIPQQQENRYHGYTLTEEDIYTLACFVYAETRYESEETRQPVAEVVLNRVMSDQYPDTVRDVIYQTEFYRAADAMKWAGEVDGEYYQAVNAAMYGPYILPEDICFYSAWEKGKDPWGQIGSFTFTKNR